MYSAYCSARALAQFKGLLVRSGHAYRGNEAEEKNTKYTKCMTRSSPIKPGRTNVNSVDSYQDWGRQDRCQWSRDVKLRSMMWTLPQKTNTLFLTAPLKRGNKLENDVAWQESTMSMIMSLSSSRRTWPVRKSETFAKRFHSRSWTSVSRNSET